MLDAKGFTKGLTKIATNVSEMRTQLQHLAIYCVYHNCQGNPNPTKELLVTLTKENKDGKSFEYSTADAGRVMKFISDFSPIVIRPASREAKHSGTRAAKGMEWKGEQEYPMWYEYDKPFTPRQIKEQDGFAILHAEVKRLLDRVKNGQLKLTPESKPAFERILSEIDNIVQNEEKKVAKAVSVQKDAELNQKAGKEAVPA